MLHFASRRECLNTLGGAVVMFCRLGRPWFVSAQWPKKRAGVELPCKILRPTGGIEHVRVAPASRWLIGAGNAVTWLWDLEADDPSAKSVELRGWSGPISPDGRCLMTATKDRAIRLWDLKADDPSDKGRAMGTFDAGWGLVRGVAISPNSHWLVTTGDDRVLRLWDLKAKSDSSKPRVLLRRQEGYLLNTSDGRWLTTGSVNPGTVGVWDLMADDPLATARLHKMKDKGYAGPQGISPDGRWLVTASPHRRLWDLRAEQPFARPIAEFGGTDHVRSLDFSPDSRWLVTGGDDGETRLYDLKATDPWSKPRQLGGHVKDSGVGDVRFTPNGRWLVTGGRDETARLWEMKAIGESPRSVVLRGHKGWVEFLSVSPDSRWLVTGASVPNQDFDGAARLWDLRAADPSEVRAVLAGHSGTLQEAIFSSDGRWLVTRATDQTARLWGLQAANE
jgi:WD40 repeat protein